MQRVDLARDPLDDLFCPFCSTQIIEENAESLGECSHLIHSGIEEDPEDTDESFEDMDVCFVMFEGGPASRNHYFVFRPQT
jgi:hypothetical protein